MPLKLKLFIIALTIFWFSIFIVVVSISLPYNALSEISNSSKNKIKVFLPEGWGFFTRNPQELRNYFLIKENGKYIQDPRLRNATLKNLWGLNRIGRTTTGAYLQNILPLVKKQMWQKAIDVDFAKMDLRSSEIPYVNIHTRSEGLKMPEEVMIIQKKIVPWAYRNFENKTGDSVNIVKLKINYVNR